MLGVGVFGIRRCRAGTTGIATIALLAG